LVIVRNPLAFLYHVYEFNALQSDADRTKRFEAEHRSNNAFDGPVVLLDEIVQVFALTNLDLVTSFLLECLDSRGIGAALIDRDLVRKTMLPNRFPEKAQSSLLIATGGEQKVDGLAFFVDGAVEIRPLAFDLDVRLVHPPTRADRALLNFAESSLQLRREFLNPTIDTRVVDVHAALRHHLLQIPIAQRVSQIPADTGQDDVLFKSVSFEVNHVGLLEGRRRVYSLLETTATN
jgi:hypothetical protein